MICGQCGRENSEGDRFCEKCRAPLETSAFSPDLGTLPTATPALIITGSEVDTSYPLGARAVIGRLASCEVPIDDRSISREHARLSRLRDGYVIEDLGSTNGTLVNGTRIEEAVLLKSGDIVTVGAVDLRFETGASSQAEKNGSADPTLMAAGVGGSHQDSSSEVHQVEEEAVLEPPTVPVGFPSLESLIQGVNSGEAVQMPTQQASVDEVEVDQSQVEKENKVSSEEESSVSEHYPATQSRAMVMPDSGSGSNSGVGDDALRAVQELVAQATDARTKLQEVEEEKSQLLQDLAEAQKVERQHESVKQTLREATDAVISTDELASTRMLVEKLVDSPKDIEVLMELGQQSVFLANLVNGYADLQNLVDRLREQTGGS